MEESIEHSPNQQRTRRSGYRSMVRKRHSRVWNESSERSVASPVRRVSEESCPVAVGSNLIYFDVNTERIELSDADPLAQAAVLEKANRLEREPVVQPSQEFLRNVRNKFVKIDEVVEADGVVQFKLEPVQPSTSKVKANYSYTQFDLDTQMLDILEGADMLAGLGSCPEQQELKEWSSPPKKEIVEVKKEPVERKLSNRRSKVKKDRRSKRYEDVRQSSFSRDVSMAPDFFTHPADLSASIVLDFESDSDADFAVDYSRIVSTPLRRRLAQIQNHIESPPQQVNRASIKRTFSRRRKSPPIAASPQTPPPAVVRRLSMESKTSDRNELSSDEEMAATQIDPDRLIPLEPSPEKEHFNASLLIKANINQLSQFFSQSVDVPDKSKSTSREASFHTVAPMPSSPPISLSPTGSPRTMNIEWLFRSETETDSLESESSCNSSSEQEEEQEIVDEVVVKAEPDEALHRMLDDDEEFLVQLPVTQKEVVPEEIVEKQVDEKVDVGDESGFVKRPQFIEPTHPPVSPEPSTSFANVPLPPPTFNGVGGGFQTAAGSGIRVSAASLAKARSIWREEDAKLARDESWQKVLALEVDKPVPMPPTAAAGGFQTARGGTIKISEEELAKAKARLQEVEREVEGGPREEPMAFGFKTAKGGGIAVSKEALEKAQTRLHEVEREVESGNCEEPTSFGFKTAKGGGISISKDALAKAQQRQQQFELEEEGTCADKPVSFGFKTAKGGGIAISKEALAKAQQRQQQFELEAESATPSKVGENSALTRAQKILHQVEHQKESGSRRKAFIPPVQKACEPAPEDSTSKRLPDDELDPETPLKRSKPNRPPLASFSTSTPNLTAASRRPEQPANDVEMADFFNDLDDRHFHELFCDEDEQKDRRPRPPLRQVRLASRFEECEEQQQPGSAQWDDSFGEVVAKLSSDGTLVGGAVKVAQQVLDARRLARERQRECGDGRIKPEQERRPRLYEFVRRKKQQGGRISLRAFVGGERVVGGAGDGGSRGVAERLRLLSVDNVAEFKFEVEAFYGKQLAQENTTGIPLGDPDAPIHLIPDDNSLVGLPEFTSAFLAAPGIDPTLVPSGWIGNAWKWILLKLASMERRLPKLFCDVTSPVNVLDQLLFRYHVEIDCAKRSVIRKMLEKDDVPGKRMVLFVSRVFRGQNPFEAEVELCDGWYPIRTVLDYPLTEAVLAGRIVVGTKLMVQGAELLNLNEGCAPLDVPIDVRLRIHANSTRRAHWLAKLGLYQVPTSFLVSCNHIVDRGGLVVRLQLVVVRVYPLMYVDKSQGSSVLRSGRVERRRNVASDANRFDNFQKLCSQVQKELESERAAVRRNGRMTVTRSTTTAELLEMVEAGLDLSYIEYDISATQRDAIVDLQRRMQEETAQEVNRRVKTLMASGGGTDNKRAIDGSASESSGRLVTPLLKVRVVDARKPEKTLLMSVWGPPEDLGEVVQERRVLEVVNLTANGSKNCEIQLKAGKSTNYRVLDRMQFDLPEGHFRKLTKIVDVDRSSFHPLYNEFDTVGVVVYVGNSDTKKFQIAYLADANMNLLGVHFWSGIKEYAYEDVVKERSLLCVSNLQWRSFSQQSTVPSSYATEYTTFSEHPKAQHFTEELRTLKATLESIDLEQFYQECTDKITSAKDKKLPRSSSFNTPLRNSSAGGTPARTLLGSCNARTPNNYSPSPVAQPVSLQKRKMELLAAAYRSPPKKSPIVLRRNPRAGKNFKTPMRLEEKIERALAND
uniref:Breast cancer type 2 susceptibility protein n=1 Tax=Culex pipiens TaxID=7175 RepID=A0A8D8IF11_CULPI